jgi:hypothetical protein
MLSMIVVLFFTLHQGWGGEVWSRARKFLHFQLPAKNLFQLEMKKFPRPAPDLSSPTLMKSEEQYHNHAEHDVMQKSIGCKRGVGAVSTTQNTEDEWGQSSPRKNTKDMSGISPHLKTKKTVGALPTT